MDGPAHYHGLRLQARCLDAVRHNTEKNRFLVGTVGLREDNEVHLLDYNEDSNEIVCERIYSHKPEVWDLSACTHDSSLFFSCNNTEAATLWRMTDMDDEVVTTLTSPLEEVLVLGEHKGVAKRVIWDPSGHGDCVVSIDDNSVREWRLDDGWTLKKAPTVVSSAEVQRMSRASWDPHHATVVATACDNGVKGWDLRSAKCTYSLLNGHAPVCRDVDYNPNKPYYLASCGDDRKLKFWDCRNPGQPLLTLTGHSHWAWRVAYNRGYDLLVLTASTDSVVNLWAAPSVSSAPLSQSLDSDTESAGTQGHGNDRLVQGFTHHEDSVYAAEWSAGNFFCFASLSYDGHVVVSHVPQALKYSILL